MKPEDALATLKILRQLPAPAGDDPRIDLLEASAQVTQNIAAAQAAAKRGGRERYCSWFSSNGGSGLRDSLSAGCRLGVSTEETISDCEKAKESYASAGDRNNEARTLNDMAATYYQLGDLHKAESMWREAAKEFRQNGGAEGLAATSNNIGDVFLQEGRLSEAKKMFEESIPKLSGRWKTRADWRWCSTTSMIYRDFKEIWTSAETTYQQAKATANEVGDKSALAYVDSGLGDVRSGSRRSCGCQEVLRRIAGLCESRPVRNKLKRKLRSR